MKAAARPRNLQVRRLMPLQIAGSTHSDFLEQQLNLPFFELARESRKTATPRDAEASA
jgi:hypothetical protein